MLASIMRVVYTDLEWVAREYMHRARAGVWKAADNDALKCFNLAHFLVEQTIHESCERDKIADYWCEVY